MAGRAGDGVGCVLDGVVIGLDRVEQTTYAYTPAILLGGSIPKTERPAPFLAKRYLA